MRHVALLVVALLLGQVAQARADEAVPIDAVRLFIAQSYRHLAQFEVTALKQFAEGSTGTGRVSTAGTATFIEPTYIPTKGVELTLQFDGFTAKQMEYYGKELGVWTQFSHAVDAEVYDVEFRAGAVRPFAIELRYRETAGGFEFFFESSNLEILGVPLGGLPTAAMVVGDAAFNDLVARFVQAKADRLTALRLEPLKTLRGDARRILANAGIGHLITTEGDALVVELTDPSRKAEATSLLKHLQTEILDSGGTLKLALGETDDGNITIKAVG